MNTKFDELLEFPCKFPFKVLGEGNYHSVRVTVTAQSKEHIEAMYTALGKIELVRYVL